MESIQLENFDPEMLFSPNEETLKLKKEIFYNSILEFGITNTNSIIHFGCNFDGGDFIKILDKKSKEINYYGIDVDPDNIEKLKSTYPRYLFNQNSIQLELDFIKETETPTSYDWVVITDLFNKNLYEKNQYMYIDSTIRESLQISNIGVIISFSTKHTEEDYEYGIGFLISYLNAIYSRFDIRKLDEKNYICCVYKWFY